MNLDRNKDSDKEKAIDKAKDILNKRKVLNSMSREILESKDPEEIKNCKVIYKNGCPYVIPTPKIPIIEKKIEKLNDFKKSLEIENKVKQAIDFVAERTNLDRLDLKQVAVNEYRLIKIISNHRIIDVSDLLINNLYLYINNKIIDFNWKMYDWIYSKSMKIFKLFKWDDKTGYGLLNHIDSKELNEYLTKYRDLYIPKIEWDVFNFVSLLINRVNELAESKKEKKINFLLFVVNQDKSCYDLFNDDEAELISSYIDNEISKPIGEDLARIRNLFWKFKPKEKEKRSKKENS